MSRISFIILMIGALFASPLTALASTVAPGSLIQGSGAAVYYLGDDGKRYAFPNDKAYFTWYADFTGVQKISDAELASYTLGGLVTYRPGKRLIKITTDPKVYAVAQNGTLRWIETEAIAAQLYGTDWAKEVDDVPDAFFTVYRIGDPITAVADYDVNATIAGTPTINIDKTLSVAPPPASTSTSPVIVTHNVTLSVSKTNPSAGEIITAQVTADPSPSIDHVDIYLDGILERSCAFAQCTTDIVMPTSGLLPSYPLTATAYWIDAYQQSATTTITPQLTSTGLISLTVTNPEVKPNGTQEIITDAGTGFSAHYLDIYLDGNDIHSCTNQQNCRYSYSETGAIGTTHQIYAIATDANGNTARTVTKSYSVVVNDHPVVQVALAKSTIYTGETIDVTVTGSDSDGVASTEVWLNGVLLKHCDLASCTVTAGPWSTPQMLTFTGTATDALGLEASGTSTALTVQSY